MFTTDKFASNPLEYSPVFFHANRTIPGRAAAAGGRSRLLGGTSGDVHKLSRAALRKTTETLPLLVRLSSTVYDGDAAHGFGACSQAGTHGQQHTQAPAAVWHQPHEPPATAARLQRRHRPSAAVSCDRCSAPTIGEDAPRERGDIFWPNCYLRRAGCTSSRIRKRETRATEPLHAYARVPRI